MSTLKVSTISPLGTDATKTITIGSAGDTAAGVFTNTPSFHVNNLFSSSVSGSGDQNISNNTNTLVNFTNKVFDTDSAFDTSTMRFTVPTGQAGKYFFETSGALNSSSDFDGTELQLRVNNSTVSVARARNENQEILKTALVVNLSVDDYVDVYIYQNSGGTVAWRGNSNERFFQGFKLIGA